MAQYGQISLISQDSISAGNGRPNGTRTLQEFVPLTCFVIETVGVLCLSEHHKVSSIRCTQPEPGQDSLVHVLPSEILCAPPFWEAQHGCLHTAIDGERKVRTHAGRAFYAHPKMQLEVSEQSSRAMRPHCRNQLGHCKTPKW